MRKHKHAGIVQWKKGIKSLKLHPVSSKHRDIYAVRCHNMETGRYKRTQNIKKRKKTTRKTIPKIKKRVRKQVEKTDKVKQAFENQDFTRMILCPVDKEGYAYFDLMTVMKTEHIKGVRVRFERTIKNGKKIVGLEIDK